ncbi:MULTISPECIES: DUF5988 family protein [unclassified Crossiella]|uniref:DUF5988 family protein n=1 Tax=unclassified Crossiella TaxID=2620835 RepID=UPI002000253D|nr:MULTISPECIES: DUF5988 family protein [unclassified Crossiella]MCK2244446.1 DUF5988 family protein [Crossiella sp. S99.2]MCK2258077.1 DUF5988 family protein [Crossiella sp. S99.1]
MNRINDTPGGTEIVLVGGPADLPATIRNLRIGNVGKTKIKIPRLGGYEHFELIAEVGNGRPAVPLVFRWTMRTKIAE